MRESGLSRVSFTENGKIVDRWRARYGVEIEYFDTMIEALNWIEARQSIDRKKEKKA